MPHFTLTMSAVCNGQTVYNSYNFDLTRPVSEAYLIQSYQEFYPNHTDVQVVSFAEAESEELVAV